MHHVRSLMRGMLKLSAPSLLQGSRLLRGTHVPSALKHINPAVADIIYVPTCVSSWVQSGTGPSLQQRVIALCERAQMRVHVVQTNGCCGQPLASQGFSEGAGTTQQMMLSDIEAALGGRAIPVFIDTSTCASALVQAARERGIEVIDQVGFVERILERIEVTPTERPLVLHPGCGAAKLGTTERFEAIARKLSTNVIIPPSATCCGMAGAHGLQHPEIVDCATRSERIEVDNTLNTTDAIGVSCNPMCQAALTNVMGMEYVGLVEAVFRY